MLEAQVTGLTKRLTVFGDRWWTAGANGYEATARSRWTISCSGRNWLSAAPATA